MSDASPEPVTTPAVAMARAEIMRAVGTVETRGSFSDRDILLLAAIVRRLPFVDLLARQRARVAALHEPRGTSLAVPPTTPTESADADLLGLCRMLGRADGVPVPPPGSVRR